MPKEFSFQKIILILLLLSNCEPDRKPTQLNIPISKSRDYKKSKPLPKIEENKELAKNKDNSSSTLARIISKKMIFTKHALCRMDCRYIDETEIKYVLKDGKINERKSHKNDKPCPTYAVESRSQDGQLVRIVCGDCPSFTKIITVIDLENEFKCDCK